VCPCASEHLPCCKSCTEGFAIPLELKKLIESKSQNVVQESTTEDGCKEEDLKRGKAEGESAEPRGLPLVDSPAEHKISSHHAMTDDGHEDHEDVKPLPAVQKDELGKMEKGAANNTQISLKKGKSEESAEPRGPPLVGSAVGSAVSSAPVSSAEHKIIMHALADGHDNDIMAQVGSSGNKVVTRRAMQSLKPGQWIKDEVINSFFHLLSHRDEELSKNDSTRKRNAFFNSFFMTKLLNEGHSNHSGDYDYSNVRNWSRKFVPGEDIFEVDKLFFVINVERTHWVLAVADMLNQKIQMYDSGSRLYNYQSIGKNGIHCLQNVFRYLQDEHLDKKNTPLPNASHWQLIPAQNDMPQQQNGKFQSVVLHHETVSILFLFSSHIMFFMEGYDCGVYACMFADRLSKDGLSSCSPEDATKNRERLVLSLVKKGPLLEYHRDVLHHQTAEQETAFERVDGQQNKRQVLDSKGDKKKELDGLSSHLQDEAETRKREKLVLASVSMKREDLMLECGEEVQPAEQQTELEGVGQQNKRVKVHIAVDEGESVTVETQEKGGTHKKDWPNTKMPALKAELRVRNLKVGGRKADLVSRLIASDLEIEKSEKRIDGKPASSQLTSDELLKLQQLEEHLHEIDECILNLKEYRGHLARHVSEDAYAQSKIDNLADDEAIVTSDYKMKILSCFYRETQKKWFGKRGTNLLGFMITTNSLDEADKL
jgi:sentrin-specific protease 1